VIAALEGFTPCRGLNASLSLWIDEHIDETVRTNKISDEAATLVWESDAAKHIHAVRTKDTVVKILIDPHACERHLIFGWPRVHDGRTGLTT
jgi:hypothetical protein